jgi:hypothetical protein
MRNAAAAAAEHPQATRQVFQCNRRREQLKCIAYPIAFTRSADAVIRVYDAAGNVIATHEHAGDFIKP